MTADACKICNGRKLHFLFQGRDRLHFIPGDFEIWRCGDCGLLFLNPCPDQQALGRYYPPKEYYSYSDSEKIEAEPLSGRRKVLFYLKHPLKALNTLIYSKVVGQNRDIEVFKGARVLDIGCGDGRYLLQKREKGAQCYGVDIGEEGLAELKKKAPDIQLHCGDLWETRWPNASFDLINLCHVLEHVKDIDKLLPEIRRLLKPGGRLRIQVPNAASLTAKLFGPFWIGLDTPRHVYVFSRKNLSRYLNESGFKVVSSRTLENSFDVIASLIYVWNAARGTRRVATNMDKIWNNEWAKLLLAPYAVLVNALGAGDVMEFIAK